MIPQPEPSQTGRRPWLNRSVLAFGLASLFSDAGHETATAILPFFLVSVGGSAAVLGLVEGVSDALSTAAKLASGWYSDGLRHRKPLGVVGYAATGVGMAAFALTWTPFQVLFVRACSWLGRGMRGPVRDAMLAEAVSRDDVGRAFGFHRAMVRSALSSDHSARYCCCPVLATERFSRLPSFRDSCLSSHLPVPQSAARYGHGSISVRACESCRNPIGHSS